MKRSHRFLMLCSIMVIAASIYAFMQGSWHIRISGQGNQDWTVFIPQANRQSTGNGTIPIAPSTSTPTSTWNGTPTPAFTSAPGDTETPSPTATSVPNQSASPSPTSAHDHDDADLYWHPPDSHGDRPAHEHGDPPPQWVMDAGYTPAFTHVAGTPGENHAYWKHTAFKGYGGRFNNQDWYGIFHMDFNPSGHRSRFHSYQLWVKDETGDVTHMHGWIDYGFAPNANKTGPNFFGSCGGPNDADDSLHPGMSPIEVGCDIEANFESWYSNGDPFAPWRFGFGINIASNYYAGGDPADPNTWTAISPSNSYYAAPNHARNLVRRIELTWHTSDTPLRGEFWTTQFGDVVSGPNAPVCGTQRSYGQGTYTVVCLRQYIAPTLRSITASTPGGNAVQKTFPGAGIVQLPN